MSCSDFSAPKFRYENAVARIVENAVRLLMEKPVVVFPIPVGKGKAAIVVVVVVVPFFGIMQVGGELFHFRENDLV